MLKKNCHTNLVVEVSPEDFRRNGPYGPWISLGLFEAFLRAGDEIESQEEGRIVFRRPSGISGYTVVTIVSDAAAKEARWRQLVRTAFDLDNAKAPITDEDEMVAHLGRKLDQKEIDCLSLSRAFGPCSIPKEEIEAFRAFPVGEGNNDSWGKFAHEMSEFILKTM